MKVIGNNGKIVEKKLIRITYYKHWKGQHLLVSNYRFVGNRGGIYEVELNLRSMTYKIRNIKQKTIVRSNKKDGRKSPSHISNLKIQAKRALISMGVIFDIEVRAV